MRIRIGNRTGGAVFAAVLRGISFGVLPLVLCGATAAAATFGYCHEFG